MFCRLNSVWANIKDAAGRANFSTIFCLIVLMALIPPFPGAGMAGRHNNQRFAELQSDAGSLAKVATLPDQAVMADSFQRLPLRFEKQVQHGGKPTFVARGSGYSLRVLPGKAELAFSKSRSAVAQAAATSAPRDSAVTLAFLDINPDADLEGIDELPGKSNYFIGSSPARWQTNVKGYRRVRCKSIYRGIDLIYYGNQQDLEYDLVLEPGADLEQVRMQIRGVDGSRLVDGDLVMDTADGPVRQKAPVAYEEASGKKKEVAVRYVSPACDQIGFELGERDPAATMVIDPVIGYSTLLGGSLEDTGLGIAVDASGSIYITGFTESPDFPVTPGVVQPTPHTPPNDTEFRDAYVTKLNAAGTAIVYSTFLGGSSADLGEKIAVDPAGNAYVLGGTSSTDFPVTNNAYQKTYRGGGDCFVTKLSPDGSSLIYSTYLGGSDSDFGEGIALDAEGNACLTGATFSQDFPTINAVQPAFGNTACQGGQCRHGFVTKLDAAGAALIYSTYLGGSGIDTPIGIATDSGDHAYVTGSTTSPDFPVVAAFPAAPFQAGLRGLANAFVTKLSSTGRIIYSTYLGGSAGDEGDRIAVGPFGNAFVVGSTSSGDFPMVNALRGKFAGGGTQTRTDAFVAEFNKSGSALVFSTYLGGSDDDLGTGLGLDLAGNIYVSGITRSTNFPTANAFQRFFAGGVGDSFIAKLSPGGKALLYSSYLGGNLNDSGNDLAVDSAGRAYVVGSTNSTDFPLVNPLQPVPHDFFGNAFITRIDP
jgi:hypothetical protein